MIRRCVRFSAMLCAMLAAPPGLAQGGGPDGGPSEHDAYEALHAWEDVRAQIRETRDVLDRFAAAQAEGKPDAEVAKIARTTVGNIREAVKDAEAILSRNGGAAGVNFARLYELIHNLHYAAAVDERTEAMREWLSLLEPLAGALRNLLPDLLAVEKPNDAGKTIVLGWRPQPDFQSMRIERFDLTAADRDPEVKEENEKDWKPVVRKIAGAGAAISAQDGGVKPNHRYKYRLRALGDDGAAGEVIATTPVVTAKAEWFNTEKSWFLLIVLIFSGSVLGYIQLAKMGVNLRVRKIAGLEAVEESVGRATEMGRPILFIPGIQDMNDIQTVAGLIILGRVAKTAAEHDALLEVPTSKSLVMTTARETVATSYLNAGRPDAYDEKKIYYITDEQFGYVAAVTGTMVREKPAACIYMGAFFAESLILAETANTVGSIQIAGTAQPAQLPFFVAACDYTLIGEEFFAASAYLSGEPEQIGSLKGQDVGKVIVLVLLLIGVVLATIVSVAGMYQTWLQDAVIFIQEKLLKVAG